MKTNNIRKVKLPVLPDNCEIEKYYNRSFRLIFHGDAGPYVSEMYCRLGNQSFAAAALAICACFDWLACPPNGAKSASNPEKDTVLRSFLVKCRENRGGRHLVPVTVQEIRFTPDEPVMEYELMGEPSGYFGEIREPLEKRGDLVKTAAGLDRITRAPHVGKTVPPPCRGFVFVKFQVQVKEWMRLCKRTKDPKLQWLEDRFAAEGIRSQRFGSSWHAPLLWVHRDDHERAGAILGPIDDMPDDHKKFRMI